MLRNLDLHLQPIGRIFKDQAVHSSWTAVPSKMGPIGCYETSINDYGSTLRNIPQER